MSKQDQVREQFYEMSFPLAGIDLSNAYSRQLPRQLPDGRFARSTRSAVNVRGFPYGDRSRGGSRPGLGKYVSSPVVADWIIQELCPITTLGYTPAGGNVVQSSQSGRIVTLVAVSQGNVYSVQAGGTSWSLADNLTAVSPPLNFTGVLYSTPLNQKLWFADGVNWCYYDPSLNQVLAWAASAGTLPGDDQGNTPRLITTWRGRIVCSGVLLDPQNWFMSAVGDPTDWNYFPEEPTPTQALSGDNSPTGVIGDVVTGLIPFSDDLLIFGGDHSIYQMSGDPMAGGQVDLVSDTIGMAWGQAWCKDPYGTAYFFSNKMGIYAYKPGQEPQRISQPIESFVQGFDSGLTTIRLLWDDAFQGMHVFLTPTTAPAATTHLFWEWRTQAWFQDVFASSNYDPLTCCTFDGNLPADRVALIGSWDGYVRKFDASATTDDGSAFTSSVLLGPITSKNLDDFVLKDLQAVLGSTSGDVTFTVYADDKAESALTATVRVTGTFSAGRSLSKLVRQAGHAIYVKLSSAAGWQMETVRAKIVGRGDVRRRGA